MMNTCAKFHEDSPSGKKGKFNLPSAMGRIHKVSRQIACGANRLARFSTRTHFVRWSSTSKVWRTFVEGKKAIMLCHRFWVFPRCSTKTDSCKFELVPARTACFWRSIYGLILEARQACRGQSKQCRSVSFHHPPADASLQKQWLIAIPLTNTPHQVKGRLCPPRARRRGTSTGLSSNHRRRRSCQIPL